jgi:hypothetical protein
MIRFFARKQSLNTFFHLVQLACLQVLPQLLTVCS